MTTYSYSLDSATKSDGSGSIDCRTGSGSLTSGSVTFLLKKANTADPSDFSFISVPATECSISGSFGPVVWANELSGGSPLSDSCVLQPSNYDLGDNAGETSLELTGLSDAFTSINISIGGVPIPSGAFIVTTSGSPGSYSSTITFDPSFFPSGIPSGTVDAGLPTTGNPMISFCNGICAGPIIGVATHTGYDPLGGSYTDTTNVPVSYTNYDNTNPSCSISVVGNPPIVANINGRNLVGWHTAEDSVTITVTYQDNSPCPTGVGTPTILLNGSPVGIAPASGGTMVISGLTPNTVNIISTSVSDGGGNGSSCQVQVFYDEDLPYGSIILSPTHQYKNVFGGIQYIPTANAQLRLTHEDDDTGLF